MRLVLGSEVSCALPRPLLSRQKLRQKSALHAVILQCSQYAQLARNVLQRYQKDVQVPAHSVHSTCKLPAHRHGLQ